MIVLLFASAQIALYTNSYYGFAGNADCAQCHNEGANLYVEDLADATVVVDGIADDTMWTQNTTGRLLYNFVGSAFGTVHMYLRMLFGQNDTHIFVFCWWEDVQIEGAATAQTDPGDGMTIMWNIDSDWPLNFPSGMATGEGTIDVWTWKAGVAAEGTEPAPDVGANANRTNVAVPTDTDSDFYINEIGYTSVNDNQDVLAEGRYGNHTYRREQHYTAEFARPLVTDDATDIQFDKTGYYDFAVGIWNGTSGEDHLMGFTHQVWVYNPNDPGHVPETVTSTVTVTDSGEDTGQATNMGILGLSIIALVAVSTIVIRRRR